MDPLLDGDPALFDIQTTAAGPAGSLPLTEEMLREAPSGGIFGLFGKVNDLERTALRQIASQLESRPAAADLLNRV